MTFERTHLLQIRTPEGVAFTYPLASPVQRLLALLVDLLIVLLITNVVSIGCGPLFHLSMDLASALSTVLIFAGVTLYPMLTEWFWRGQTIGKRFFNLRVIDEQGLRLTFNQIVVRNLLRYVDLLPAFYLVGGGCAFLSRRAQRLGDIAANTIVVYTPKVSEPDVQQIMGGKYNSFRDYPLQLARLRQHAAPEGSEIALRAILRREKLEPEARVELFRDIADYFRACVPFPEDATAGLSDEHYVRNVVDILFRTAGT